MLTEEEIISGRGKNRHTVKLQLNENKQMYKMTKDKET
jgi:hypothetical protein